MRSLPPGLTIHRRHDAFTLVELLLAITILAFILSSLASIMGQTTRAWRIARSQLQQFREAESAFEQMTRRITDATLNTYHDYEFPGGDTQKTPTRYIRQSEMHFVCGPSLSASGGIPSLLGSGVQGGSHAIFFQGPFGEHETSELTGLNTLLNAWGYFIEFGNDDDQRPSFLSGAVGSGARYRFRLMEFRQATESLAVYDTPLSSLPAGQLFNWFNGAAGSGDGVHTLAENVLALIVRPLAPDDTMAATAIAPSYYYDTRAYQRNAGGAYEQQRSRHQLPPSLEITLVVMDEASGARLQATYGTSLPAIMPEGLFQTSVSYDSDVKALEEALIENQIQFRILKKTVRLRNARWSRAD